ncbi:MAG TPA: lysine--tRNA ligase [Myxococcota bacterium]|nr:lysine--tRNA ligase [Myxococcota bacterium]HRY95245.1 lysine--tRNA ligase [Myxococcota bacterium]HSA22900.1 lysine--tRNA ligase [Myxococcota bacterium]
MDEQSRQRRLKLDALRERNLPLYPNDFRPEHHTADVQAAHGEAPAEALAESTARYSLAGRVMALRSFGKAAFLKLRDRTGDLQIFASRDGLGEDSFQLFRATVEVGDIVGVSGKPMRTKTGELSVQADGLRLLTKSLQPLPEKWHGLTDVEIRYRRRYLDLIVNPDVRKVFEARARIVRHVRAFLDARGFLEVETPMMHALAGGATARPFATHHNALDMPLYLRVAPELHLKRLLVGGLERVYELNRCFRNEGVSTQHNPEFTMLEFYQAYATYEDLMRLTEELLAGLAREVCGSTTVPYQGQAIELGGPYRRLSAHGAVAEALGVGEEVLARPEELARLARANGLQPDGEAGKTVMALFELLVEPKLIQPTFVCDFPLAVSPLARKKAGRPELVDRFELYVAGREMANAFSELNDPEDQRERFAEQMRAKAKGDEEAMPFDEDYVLALEYGMPPAGGQGIGIDRLVMLLCDAASIRDVILFPLLRPERPA